MLLINDPIATHVQCMSVLLVNEMHVISVQAAKQQIESESGSQQEPGLLQRWFPGWMSGYQGQHNQQPGEVHIHFFRHLKNERANV